MQEDLRFWGVVVKPGETVKCDPGESYYHISQIALEAGNAKEKVEVFVNIDDKRIMLSTLSVDNGSHFVTDLVFEKKFELLHSSVTSNICFTGYRFNLGSNSSTKGGDESDEEVPLLIPLDSNTDGYKNNEATHGSNKLTAPRPADAPSSIPKATVEEPTSPGKPKGDDKDKTDAQKRSDGDDCESSEDVDYTRKEPKPYWISGIDEEEAPPGWDPVPNPWNRVPRPSRDMHPKGTPVYPKGSPKYNLMQVKSKTTMKKPSPKFRKRSSPIGDKSRASWTPALEKALVELLHEHNTTYHRSQNGWSTETWNMMVSIFQQRHPHVKFTKSQVQDKEKDLKRDYRILMEARKQSGVGWNEAKGMLQAEPHLWENLKISLGDRIKKFKRKAFPLYDSLGELYDGQLAEGKLCFTSTAEPSIECEDIESDGDYEGQKEMEGAVARDKGYDDDLQIIDGGRKELEGELAGDKGWEQIDDARRSRSYAGFVGRNKSQVGAAKKNRSQVGASSVNPKNIPKKKSADGIVGVMERLVEIKEKEAKKEVAHDFTITRCMEALKTLEGVTPDEKITASEVFNNAQNREFFINLVADKDGTAILWLRRQLARLT